MSNKIPIALQMYTLRDDAEKDFAGTIKQVAALGYYGVELAGYSGHSAAEVKQILEDNNLKVVGGHVGYDQILGDPEKVIEEYSAFGAKYVAIPWIGEDKRQTLDDYKKLGATFTELGAKLKPDGITLCYHNHAFEFEKFGGDEYGFDALFAAADPSLLQVEMDTYWVKKGGEEPDAYLRKYANRVPLVHLKDMGEDGDFRPVGEGTIDYPSLFTAAEEAAGTEYYIVEQDVCRTATPLESVAISIGNLKKWGKL